MSKLKLSLAPVLLTLSAPVIAISNIEDERPGFPDESWHGVIELGIDGKTGNQEEESYSAATRLTYRKENNIVLGILQREYGKTNGIKDTNDSFVHGRWTHMLNDKWASEGFAQWEENEFDNLKSRALLGGGMRYVVAEQEDIFSLSLGIGGFREREILDLGTYEDKTWLWRVNSFAVYKHRLNEQIVLSATAYYQPNTQDFDDYRVLMETALSVKLTDALDLKIQYHVMHDSQPAKNPDAVPPIDNHETNTTYTTTLVYSF